MNENITTERELGWDDTIQNDSTGFVLLPEGNYQFVVESMDRKRFAGSAKLPPCNEVELTLYVGDLLDRNNSTTIRHQLFLHTKTEGLLCAFFTAIGQRKHGEPLRMNWPSVVHASGWCHLIVDTWTGRDGTDHQSNKIGKFLEPDVAPVQTSMTAPAPASTPAWANGKF